MSIICSDPGILWVSGIDANTAAANPFGAIIEIYDLSSKSTLLNKYFVSGILDIKTAVTIPSAKTNK